MPIQRAVHELNIGGWGNLPFFGNGEWDAVADFLDLESLERRDWHPIERDIFKALRLTAPDRVKVVIIGQDPYPDRARATGLAFSFPPGRAARDSLCNIYAELFEDVGARRVDGNLEDWAQKGVLLLNTALTVQTGIAGSHRRHGWENLTLQILTRLSNAGDKVFMAWGRDARKVCGEAMVARPNLVLESAHPLARPNADIPFAGSLPFSQANAYLGDRAIEWGNLE